MYFQLTLTHYENSGKVKISTVRVRKHEIGRLLPYIAHIKLRSVTRKQYQYALNDLKEQGLSETTIEGVHVTGRMIFKKAIEFELIKNNPTQYATMPKTIKSIEELEAEEEIIKYLEKEELSLFLKTAKEKGLDKDYPTSLYAYHKGHEKRGFPQVQRTHEKPLDHPYLSRGMDKNILPL